MSKRKNERSDYQASSGNSDSDNSSSSASDSEFLTLANKKQRNTSRSPAADDVAGAANDDEDARRNNNDAVQENSDDSSSGASSDSDSNSSSGSDDEDDGDGGGGGDGIDADELKLLEEDNIAEQESSGVAASAILPPNTRRVPRNQSTASQPLQTSIGSDVEDGQVSSDDDDEKGSNNGDNDNKHHSSASVSHSSSGSSTDSDDDNDDTVATTSTVAAAAAASEASGGESESEFNDGYDEQLMGDAADRERLEGLTEKERETEIFKRIERRDVMKTRWEIERKLKLAKRARAATATAAMALETDAAGDKRKAKPAKQQTAYASVTAANASIPVAANATTTASAVSTSAQPPVEWRAPLDKSLFEPMDFNDSDDEAAREYFDPKERSKERKKNVEANRTDDKRSSAMALLKAKREGKAKREEEEAKRIAQRNELTDDRDEIDAHGKPSIKLKASDIYSDDSGSSDSDDDDDDGDNDHHHHHNNASDSRKTSRRHADSRSADSDDSSDNNNSKPKSAGSTATTSASAAAAAASSKRPAAAVHVATKAEMAPIRLSRHKIERFIALPHFARVVTNCFVRISIGNNNSRPVYRVAEIVGVVETPKIYTLGKSRTNRGLRLKHGTSERVFRLEFISNQDFSDSEFDKWRAECGKYAQLLPTLDFVERKQREIREAIQYEFKDEDVHRIIAEKNRFRQYPTNYAMKKTVLMKERDAAVLRGDDEIAADINVQIEELDERANELDKKRSSTISLISYINDRNRKRNVEEAEKAIMEEVRASRGLKTDDPFTRRSTKPTMAFKAPREAAESLMPMVPAPAPPGRGRGGGGRTEEGRTAAGTDNNLYLLHDFEIDLDVTLPANPINAVQKPVARPKDAAPKRSLNLEDYKKKRGLI